TTPSSDTIRIIGFVNQCYKPNKWIVFVTSIPAGRFESRSVVLNSTGRFTLTLDRAKLTPDDYLLNFGKQKKGAGGRRFTIEANTLSVNLGEIGECDV